MLARDICNRCIIQLGVPGKVEKVDIDTIHFKVSPLAALASRVRMQSTRQEQTSTSVHLFTRTCTNSMGVGVVCDISA
jgi:allantoicase